MDGTQREKERKGFRMKPAFLAWVTHWVVVHSLMGDPDGGGGGREGDSGASEPWFLEGAVGVGREQNLMSSGSGKFKVLLEQRGGVQQAAEPLGGEHGCGEHLGWSEVWESLR